MEYETSADLRNATEKLDNRDFKGQSVRCIADVSFKNSRYDQWRALYLDLGGTTARPI